MQNITISDLLEHNRWSEAHHNLCVECEEAYLDEVMEMNREAAMEVEE